MAIQICVKRLLPLLLGFSSFQASAVDMEGWKPSAAEAAVLPEFCYRQFFGDKFKGPQYHWSPETCGVGMNHYCPGLVVLNRANKSYSNRKLRRGFLLSAEKKVVYTIKAMEKYPSCVIRPHVEATYQLIETQLRGLR
jgi:hypothetical protein